MLLARVGQDCVCTRYKTVYLVISLPKSTLYYTYTVYLVLANPADIWHLEEQRGSYSVSLTDFVVKSIWVSLSGDQ